MKEIVVFGIGSNLGNQQKNLDYAIKKLPVNNKKISSIIRTNALLPKYAPQEWDIDYLNTVVVGAPIFDPSKTFEIIKNIERKMGRKRSKRWAPRIIDIDILFWGRRYIDTDYLRVPHKEFHNRFFTLKPAADIMPLYVHKKYNVNILTMLRSYIANRTKNRITDILCSI